MADKVGAMIDELLHTIIYQINFGWNLLHRDFTEGKLKPFSRVANRVISLLPWLPHRKKRQGWECLPWEDETILPKLHSRFTEFRSFFLQELPVELRLSLNSTWFKLWVEDYELYEAVYFQMKAAKALILAEPSLVVLYLREKDPYSLST